MRGSEAVQRRYHVKLNGTASVPLQIRASVWRPLGVTWRRRRRSGLLDLQHGRSKPMRFANGRLGLSATLPAQTLSRRHFPATRSSSSALIRLTCVRKGDSLFAGAFGIVAASPRKQPLRAPYTIHRFPPPPVRQLDQSDVYPTRIYRRKLHLSRLVYPATSSRLVSAESTIFYTSSRFHDCRSTHLIPFSFFTLVYLPIHAYLRYT